MSKIAVAGKGGVGKTTFSALLAYSLVAAGETVYAIDADPNPTLGQALGFPEELLAKLIPIIAMKDLVEERTGARPGESGAYFRLNPRVDDIPERFAVSHRGIRLLQMGSVKGAGAGCVCPENSMVKALVTHLVLRERETVLLDMVAGLDEPQQFVRTPVAAAAPFRAQVDCLDAAPTSAGTVEGVQRASGDRVDAAFDVASAVHVGFALAQGGVIRCLGADAPQEHLAGYPDCVRDAVLVVTHGVESAQRFRQGRQAGQIVADLRLHGGL